MTKNVAQASNEWNRLEANFKLTMPQAQIQGIERIQNKNLWRKYQNEYKDVGIKYGGKEHATEAEMYHGTRGTAPALIYKSEEGFDITYSNVGLWGVANYFAKNSSYSNGYSHSKGDGTR